MAGVGDAVGRGVTRTRTGRRLKVSLIYFSGHMLSLPPLLSAAPTPTSNSNLDLITSFP